MDRQELMNLAQRVAHAPSYEARLGELFRLAPESTLNRYGLAHQTGWGGPMMAMTGAFVLGAGIGAGIALLFAPYPGEELRGRLRQRAERLGEGVKDATHKAEDKVVHARDRVMSTVQSKTGSGYSAANDVGSDIPIRNTGY